jgi:hypothetical protein
LGKSRPRLFIDHLTTKGGEILDVESVADKNLEGGEILDVDHLTT